MVTQTRHSDRTRYTGFSQDVADCGTDMRYDLQTVQNVEYEYVESYRGKVQYIDVGSKRRKMFHPFSRYRHSAGEQTVGRVCAITSKKYIGYAEDFPWVDIARVHLDSTFRETTYGTRWSGDLMPLGWYAMGKIGDELRQFVIRDLYAKANAPKYNIAVFLAELDETIVGLHGLFKGCLESLFRIKRLTGNVKHLFLNPEELWLWYRYMLVPTILDAEELIKALKTDEIIDRVQDGIKLKEPEIHEGTFYRLGYGYGLYDIPFRWKSEVKYGIGGAIDILSRHDPAKWGTSAHDVLMGTWERMLFSFVFDWFINVGDWLASLRNIDVVFAQSYATYAIDAKTTIDVDCNPWYLDSEPEYRCFRMDRIVDLDRPSLPLIDRRWGKTLRYIDGTALIIGMLKSVLKRRK